MTLDVFARGYAWAFTLARVQRLTKSEHSLSLK
jgi:hypothetical protein